MNTLKRTVLSTALATAMGTSATASAVILDVSYEGWFTMLNPGGTAALINGDAYDNAMYGNRSAITGTMSINTLSGAGSGTMAGFSFFGSGLAEATNISLQAVGDGAGGTGPLFLTNLGFNWAGNLGIPVSVVLDASGLDTLLYTSDIISGSGALAATDDFVFGSSKFSYTLPLGPSPIVTTTFNTTDVGSVTMGTNPSGTLPFTDDGIGGSPMSAGPFPGFNANFDITTVHIISMSYVPVPAAVWLFGSGLMGLIGVARRNRAA